VDVACVYYFLWAKGGVFAVLGALYVGDWQYVCEVVVVGVVVDGVGFAVHSLRPPPQPQTNVKIHTRRRTEK